MIPFVLHTKMQMITVSKRSQINQLLFFCSAACPRSCFPNSCQVLSCYFKSNYGEDELSQVMDFQGNIWAFIREVLHKENLSTVKFGNLLILSGKIYQLSQWSLEFIWWRNSLQLLTAKWYSTSSWRNSLQLLTAKWYSTSSCCILPSLGSPTPVGRISCCVNSVLLKSWRVDEDFWNKNRNVPK